MSLLESPPASSEHPSPPADDDEVALFRSMSFAPLDLVIDLENNEIEIDGHREAPDEPVPDQHSVAEPAAPASVSGVVPVPAGVRLQRIRLTSVAAFAGLLCSVAFAATIGAVAALWFVASKLGLVDQVETLATNALGLDQFTIAGGSLLGGFAIVVAGLCLLGFVLTMVAATVYNLGARIFGGLAIDTAPLAATPAAPSEVRPAQPADPAVA